MEDLQDEAEEEIVDLHTEYSKLKDSYEQSQQECGALFQEKLELQREVSELNQLCDGLQTDCQELY